MRYALALSYVISMLDNNTWLSEGRCSNTVAKEKYTFHINIPQVLDAVCQP